MINVDDSYAEKQQALTVIAKAKQEIDAMCRDRHIKAELKDVIARLFGELDAARFHACSDRMLKLLPVANATNDIRKAMACAASVRVLVALVESLRSLYRIVLEQLDTTQSSATFSC